MRFPSAAMTWQLARSRPHIHMHGLDTRHLAFSASCAGVPAGDKQLSDEDTQSAIFIDGWKYPIFSSDRIKERKSIFLAHASALSTPSELPGFIDSLQRHPSLKRATHFMYAYKVIPDPVSLSSNKCLGQHDGGERGSGERLSRLLEALDCHNVVVVVSRWYGGVPLGSDRWKMISSVAKEALNRGHFAKPKCTDSASTTPHKSRRRKK